MTFNRAIRAAAALTIAAGAIAAHPAMANDTATTAQISGAVKGEAAGPLGQGDKEFTQLFASWKKLDGPSDSLAGAPRAAVSVPSLMPVNGARLTSAFGMRSHPILHRRKMHDGVDLAVPTGTPVYAPADGKVEMAERYGTYGNFIEIEHGGTMETRYGHLSAFNVTEGEYVHKGDVIGYVGSTGRSTGPHLHYEVRVNGEAVDPMPYLMMGQVALTAGEGGQGDGDSDD